MDEIERERFSKLNDVYYKATCVCDPIEFMRRQQDLLYELAEFILRPYKEREELLEENKDDFNDE